MEELMLVTCTYKGNDTFEVVSQIPTRNKKFSKVLTGKISLSAFLTACHEIAEEQCLKLDFLPCKESTIILKDFLDKNGVGIVE